MANQKKEKTLLGIRGASSRPDSPPPAPRALPLACLLPGRFGSICATFRLFIKQLFNTFVKCLPYIHIYTYIYIYILACIYIFLCIYTYCTSILLYLDWGTTPLERSSSSLAISSGNILFSSQNELERDAHRQNQLRESRRENYAQLSRSHCTNIIIFKLFIRNYAKLNIENLCTHLSRLVFVFSLFSFI